MRVTVSRRGFAAALRKIDTLSRVGAASNVSRVRIAGEEIMTDVRASREGQGVPRDTGALAASGQVIGPVEDDTVILAFGGAAAPYALRQHEDMTYRHTVGEARYLVRGLERFVAGGGVTEALKANADEAIAAAKRAV